MLVPDRDPFPVCEAVIEVAHGVRLDPALARGPGRIEITDVEGAVAASVGEPVHDVPLIALGGIAAQGGDDDPVRLREPSPELGDQGGLLDQEYRDDLLSLGAIAPVD